MNDFKIHHIAGKHNQAADTLSRKLILNGEQNEKGKTIIKTEDQEQLLSVLYQKHKMEFQILNAKEQLNLLKKKTKNYCFKNKEAVWNMFEKFLHNKQEVKNKIMMNVQNEGDDSTQIQFFEGEVQYLIEEDTLFQKFKEKKKEGKLLFLYKRASSELLISVSLVAHGFTRIVFLCLKIVLVHS